MGERRGVYRVLIGKSEGRRPLERTRLKWENNIKIAFPFSVVLFYVVT